MKNYYDLKNQLELCKIKLNSLIERKETLNTFLSPKTIEYGKVSSKGGSDTDPFVNYVYTKIAIEKQISLVEMEINILEKNLKKMDDVMRSMNNIKYKIFVYRFLDNLSVADIAKKTHFSTRRIYQILKNIDRTLNL